MCWRIIISATPSYGAIEGFSKSKAEKHGDISGEYQRGRHMTGRKRKREAGMITVEGVLSLVPFIIVILGIISFINIFAVHNKIQYALYQIGSELSCYTYFYQALGVRAADIEGYGGGD